MDQHSGSDSPLYQASASTLSVISRQVHRQQLEILRLQTELQELRAIAQAQSTRLSWIEQFIQRIRRAVATLR